MNYAGGNADIYDRANVLKWKIEYIIVQKQGAVVI